ncbi:MAG: hypothetical protein H0W88_09570 [Parachlamydiaceae bacterium]|nr:hypothetical protein [Parachlamydiaceae bacterium]
MITPSLPSPSSPEKDTSTRLPVKMDAIKVAQERLTAQPTESLSPLQIHQAALLLEEQETILIDKVNTLKEEILELRNDNYKTTNILIDSKSKELEVVTSKLGEIQQRISEQSQFIKNAIQSIRSKKTRSHTTQKSNLFIQAVSIGLKGYVDPEMTSIQRTYSGTHQKEFSKLRMENAENLLYSVISGERPLGLGSKDDQMGLALICKHRDNFHKMCSVYPSAGITDTKLISKIQGFINELEELDSRNTITLENGSRCFVLPGGWSGHYISFEIRKNPDETFEFIIHNRGEGADSENLHGNIRLKKGDKTYARTRIPIRVRKDVLLDPNFINFLTTEATSNNPESTCKNVYDRIHEFLIERGNGKILVSENEKLIASLLQLRESRVHSSEKREIDDFIFQIIKSDPNFHSLQLYGTCGESNLITTERDMASTNVQKALKRFSIGEIIDGIRRTYLVTPALNLMKTTDCNKAIDELSIHVNENVQEASDLVILRKSLLEYETLEKEIQDLENPIIINNLTKSFEDKKAKKLELRKQLIDTLAPYFEILETSIKSIRNEEINNKLLVNLNMLKTYMQKGGSPNSLYDFKYFFKDFQDKLKGNLSEDSAGFLAFQDIQKAGNEIQRFTYEIYDFEKKFNIPEALNQKKEFLDNVKIIINATIRSLADKIKPNGFKISPKYSTNPFVVALFEELQHQVIIKLNQAEKLNIHLAKRQTQLSEKLTKVGKKPKRIVPDDIRDYIEQIVEKDNSKIVRDKELMDNESDFDKSTKQTLFNFGNKFKTIKIIYSKELQHQAMIALENEALKYQKILFEQISHLTKLEMQRFDANTIDARKKFEIEIEKDPEKDQKIIEFDKKMADLKNSELQKLSKKYPFKKELSTFLNSFLEFIESKF